LKKGELGKRKLAYQKLSKRQKIGRCQKAKKTGAKKSQSTCIQKRSNKNNGGMYEKDRHGTLNQEL